MKGVILKVANLQREKESELQCSSLFFAADDLVFLSHREG